MLCWELPASQSWALAEAVPPALHSLSASFVERLCVEAARAMMAGRSTGYNQVIVVSWSRSLSWKDSRDCSAQAARGRVGH